MAKKLPGRLVALSASAVATIYVAGLLSTQRAAEGVAAASAGAQTTLVTTPASTLTGTAADATSTPIVVVGASATATPTTSSGAAPTAASATSTTPTAAGATPTTAAATATARPAATSTPAATATPTTSAAASTAAAATTTTYADGTYSATGTSALGDVTVSVTVSGDKITNVQITKVTTKFPVSRIASLPAQVIQNQSANVNVVTGATYSSQAFRQAVQLALSQALAANSTTAAG
jgi:uncharacterized protein with FMN-binding domain